MISILIVIVCLLLNALLSCAEMAFVTVDKKKLRNASLGGDSRAKIIEAMQKVPERLLSVVQIGITLVGAISAAVSGAGAEESISPILMEWFNVSEPTAETMAIVIVVLPLTILSVIIGELVPKSVAIRYSLSVILLLSRGLKIAEKILGPLINPMEKVTNLILKVLLPKKSSLDLSGPGDEISLQGLKKDHRQYIHNLIDLEAKTVKENLRPWADVDYLLYESDSKDVLERILSNGHTRLPVVANGEVCGFLHAKEFLNLFRSGVADNWVSFIRPPRFVPPTMKLLEAMKLMQKNKAHILMVGDEKETIGIMTLEDVLEQVVGEIIDEDEDGKVNLFLRRKEMPQS